MDGFGAVFGVAILAVRLIGIVRVVRIVVVNETTAVTAVGVIIFVAVMTERYHAVSLGFLAPDAVKTAVAECGEFLEAVITHETVVEFVQGIFGKFCSAVEAGELFRHGFVLLKM